MFGISTAVIVKGLVAVGTNMLVTLCSEEIIEWTVFFLAEKIVASTKNTKDDVWLAKFKSAYQNREEEEEDEEEDESS